MNILIKISSRSYKCNVGSEPGWTHKFFFTNRLWKRARAHDAGPKARGGYWLRIGESEIFKENDGTPIGSKKQRVFHEGMHIKNSKRTNWHLNEYVIFEEQPLKSNDDKKKVRYKDPRHQFSFAKHLFGAMVMYGDKIHHLQEEAWILCELFQKNVAEEKEGGKHNSEYPDQAGLLPVGLPVPSSKKMPHSASRPEAFPVVDPTLAGDQPSDAISGVEKLNQTPSGSYDGPSDAQSSARSAGGWKEKRVEDYTSLDHDEFLAFMEECLNNPPDWYNWGLESCECSPLPSGMVKDC